MNEDAAYLLSRARQERARGNTCEDNAVALVHLQFAEEYERRARRFGAFAEQPRSPGEQARSLPFPIIRN
ncbi:hypothetical protein SAMN06297144_0278 [Sphingomonas guangdongensis]|uniref:Uncharacterized protein n=1 Tax=Sphingomonas guangdongensis TaxID=1141890 RepID=A0A285QFR5_9SPHN|nr:hypothetical protein [Sphingomonas guangdongensis]SOB78912.1 hypothetical protein SAMN06297144_0278 [Sphingomonas guangdongensis]